MGSPRSGGSASSGKHVDCSSDGRGSGGELLGTLNAGEGHADGGGHGSGHWCSWWLVGVGLGFDGLAAFNGPPSSILGLTGCHPDSSSTAAESFSASDSLSSGWSVGTVGEGLLTSGAFGTWCWGGLTLEECLDCLEIISTLDHLGLELSSVCVVGFDLACKNGGIFVLFSFLESSSF